MDNNMSGILFLNDKKTKDNQPDFTGKVTVQGVEYRLAGWKKVGQNSKFISLAVSVPQDKQAVELASEIKTLAEANGREWGAFKEYLQGKYADCKSLSEAIQKHEKEIKAELAAKPTEDVMPWEEGGQQEAYPPDWDS